MTSPAHPETSTATDPTGKVLLSYRRSRADEADLLVAAQRDRGIPTWRDVHDLHAGPVTDQLEEALASPEIAGALLWLTPEVAGSDVIKGLEIPRLLERARRGDGFFVEVVAAGGLGYEEAARVAGPLASGELSAWNLRKLDADPAGPADAARVADWVLGRRLQAVHRSLPGDEPLGLALYARAPAPVEPGTALALDWHARFEGRLAPQETWDRHLGPALEAVREALHRHAPGRGLEASGLPTLTAAYALGRVFLAPGGDRLGWWQPSDRRADELWSLDAGREPCGFTPTVEEGSPEAGDVALLLSVITAVRPPFEATPDLPPFRAVVEWTPPGKYPHDLATPGQAGDLARRVTGQLRELRAELGPVGRVHLFAAIPAGLAVLLGRLSNTLGPVVVHEHLEGGMTGRYGPGVEV